MKFTAAFLSLAACVAAAPVTELIERQIGAVGTTANELSVGSCRDIIFIFARGSTEIGNLGGSVGPPTCNGLKREYGSSRVACQGVGGPYDATLGANVLPEGTTSAAYNEAIRLFTLANTNQGAAVMVASIRRLSSTIKNQIAGVVLYGNTRNAQENGKIPNFPTDRVETICALTDGVCYGTLTVTAGHLSYGDDVGDAVDFLSDRIGDA
ncbi:hypothetical protein KC318_g7059 [Hortaea werneckii]|uniref:Cutinase n=1 Tax=Hortaea werneckii TaxID=91943 RepID=A0A3M6ZXS7_HORWE|nr:hypothetical protein KC334_g14051 [Hortaea werneckii]KAI7007052.1 hypothetical protein KC355_g7476 [Hortaea werneckii]KAI7665529.1 hypothetical protein KC318_g7059 [Hortaea werneckii]RMY20033.1 hypothetical protein D0867_04294 [Hortaea werneckii]RMY35615.1 hypothetical protein D0866_04485 [Hortaea werneckii]